MNPRTADRGARGLGTASTDETRLVSNDRFQAVTHEGPGAHILRFFLGPDQGRGLRITPEDCREFDLRPGVELLYADDRNFVFTPWEAHGAVFDQVVVDLAGARDHASHVFRARRCDRVVDDRFKGSIRKVFDARVRLGMTQQALWRKNDEGRAVATTHLTPKDVEILRRIRAVHDLNTVFGAGLKEALHTSARMLGALPFVAMRQEHDQATHSAPFYVSRSNELIDDDLCTVYKVAKLGFPKHKSARVSEAIAVLKAQDRRFREQAVVDLETCLVIAEMIEGGIFLAGVLVD